MLSSWRLNRLLAERATVQKADSRMQELAADTPFLQCFAFTDGDVKLAESDVVAEYLDYKYADQGTKLFPTDPYKLALVRPCPISPHKISVEQI